VLRDPLVIAAVLCLNVAVSEWLVHRTHLRHLGSALVVIILTALTANLGLIPPYADDLPVYTGVFTYVAPIGIFCLLLQVRLSRLWQVGLPLFALFLIGAVGTVAGVLCGMAVVGEEAFGPKTFALGWSRTARCTLAPPWSTRH